MSDPNTLTRRRFLEVTALVGGGLVVGCQIRKGTGGDPFAAGPMDSATAVGEAPLFQPNAWIAIGRRSSCGS